MKLRKLLPKWLRSTRQPFARPLTRLQATPLEDRLTPTVTPTLAGTELTLTFDALNDTATVSLLNNGKIEVVGTNLAATQFDGVTKIIAGETGTFGNQSLTFGGSNSFTFAGGVVTGGIESVAVNRSITVAAPTTFDGATDFMLAASLDSNSGLGIMAKSIALTAAGDLQTTGGSVLFRADSVSIPNGATVQAAVGFQLAPFSGAVNLLIGGTDSAGNLGLSAGEVGRITASVFEFSTAPGNGNINVDANVFFDGLVNITGTSQVNVNSTLQASGTITITTSDQATSGQNIAVGGTVQSTGGNVLLQSGDDLNISGTVRSDKAAGTVTLNVDFSGADPDVNLGGTLNLTGTLKAAGGTTITGNADSDTFNVTAQANSSISIDGGAPALPTLPGDTLVIDAQGAKVLSAISPVLVTGRLPVTFTNIESLQIDGASNTQKSGTTGDDVIVVFNDGTDNVYTLNNVTTVIKGTSFEFDGLAGNDTFTVDRSKGVITLTAIDFDGGSPGESNLARVIGAGTSAISYRPDAANPGDGLVTIDGVPFGFTDLTPLDVVGGATFTLDLPNGKDEITIEDGKLAGDPTLAALALTGFSGGVAIEAAFVRNVTTVTVNTTLVAEAANDVITVNAVSQAPLVSNLSIITSANKTDTDSVTFNNPVDLAGDLSVTSNAISLAAGATTVSTGGLQLFSGKTLTINANSTFQAGSNITVSADLGGIFSADFNTTANTTLDGNVNVDTLRTNAGGSTVIDGAGGPTTVTALTLIEFGDNVTLSENAVFQATTVTFKGTLDGGKTAEVKATTTGFNQSVGGGTRLTSLKTDNAGMTTFGGALVQTTGLQQFDDVVNSAATTFDSNGNGNITFGQTLTATGNTKVNTGGVTLFTGAVNVTGTLETDTTGTSQTKANITASGTINIRDPFTTTGNIAVESLNGDVDFDQLVTANGGNLDVNANPGTVFFDAGANVTAGHLTTDTGGSTSVGGNISATGDVIFNDAVTTAAVSIGGANVRFFSTLTGGNLTVNSNGLTLFNDTVSGAGTLATNPNGTVTVNADITRNGTITFNEPVSVNGSRSISSTGGAVDFNDTLTGNADVTVSGNTASSFDKIVNVTGTFTVNGGTSTLAAGITAGGDIVYNAAANITGGQTLAADNITFNSTLTGGDLTLNTNGNGVTKFGDTVTGAGFLTTNADGTTNVNAGITRGGNIFFFDAVTTSGNRQIQSTGGDITFNQTLDSTAGSNLSLVSNGKTTFNGDVTGGGDLTTDNGAGADSTEIGLNVDITRGGAITFGDLVNLANTAHVVESTGEQNITFSNTLNGPGGITINTDGVTSLNAVTNVAFLRTDAVGSTTANGDISADVDITFGDAVTTVGSRQFTANIVNFQSTLTGGDLLLTTTGGGVTTFGGTVTGTGTLTTNPDGITRINADITRTGAIDLNDAVTISGTRTVSSDSTVNFDGSVDGTAANTDELTVTTAALTTFGGTVSATTRLKTITTNGGGTTTFSLAGVVVQTSSFQNYQDAVTSNTASFLTDANDLTFANGISNTGLLTINAGNLSNVNGTVQSGTFDLTNDSIVLLGNTSFISGADLLFPGTIKSDSATARTLSVTANAGVVTFNGAVGGAANPVGTFSVSSNQTKINANLTTGSATFDSTGNGVLQAAGNVFTMVGTLTISGAGGATGFVIDNLGNDFSGNTGFGNGDLALISYGLLNVNVTDASPVRIASAGNKNNLAAVKTATVNTSLVSAGGDITIRAGNRFLIEDFVSNGTATLANLGTGVLRVIPNLSNVAVDKSNTADFHVRVNAEIVALRAEFGDNDVVPLANLDNPPAATDNGNGDNKFPDRFIIRPSNITTLYVFGNSPVPSKNESGLDRLLPIFDGTSGVGLTFDGQKGKYTFGSGQKNLVFYGIDTLDKLSLAAFVVEITEPGDVNTPIVNGKDIPSPQYAIRITRAQDGTILNSTLDGNGFPETSFLVSPRISDSRFGFGAPKVAIGDFDGNGRPDLAVANGPSTRPFVTVIDGDFIQGSLDLSKLRSDQVLAQFFAYDPTFSGGFNIAMGDLNGDGKAEIVTSPEQGGAAHIRIFEFFDADGNSTTQSIDDVRLYTPNPAGGLPSQFFAFATAFRGGARVSIGDVTGDGKNDLVVAAGRGGGPHVKIYDGTKNQTTPDMAPPSFFAYEANFRGGVFVDVGDYNSDNKADILVGAGPGGAARVRVFDSKVVTAANSETAVVADFFAYGVPGSTFDTGTNQLPGLYDPLIRPIYSGGVGGVAFGLTRNNAMGTNSRDILVTTPRGLRTAVRAYVGNAATPTALALYVPDPTKPAENINGSNFLTSFFFTTPGIPGFITPTIPTPGFSLAQTVYGATVAGFVEVVT